MKIWDSAMTKLSQVMQTGKVRILARLGRNQDRHAARPGIDRCKGGWCDGEMNSRGL